MKRRKPETALALLEGQRPEMADGRHRINLTRDEREALARQRLVEDAVALFLDLDTDRTNAQIADALGLSKDQLKRLTQADDFRRVYENALLELGHSPRLGLVSQSIDEMMPLAVRTVQSLLINAGTPAGVRLKAAEMILGYADLKKQGSASQVEQFKNFLKSVGASSQASGAIAVEVPPAYQAALQENDIVDGEVSDVGN